MNPSPIFGQAKDQNETEIRNLENLQRTAILKGDTSSLLKLWSPHFVVNNPADMVVNVKQILSLMKTGKIDYTNYEQVIEKITFTENAATVMGREIVNPEKSTNNAGKTVTRRYTDVWLQTHGHWQLIARQATIVMVK